MNEEEINTRLKELAKTLPRFPDGRIDYTHSDKAAVLTCFVKFQNEILLLKRSDKVGSYQGKWHVVAGYLDELKGIRENVLKELKEEVCILQKHIQNMKIGTPFEHFDSNIQKTWLIHPVLVELKQKPEIKLDWEHTEFRWINPEEITNYDIVPRIDVSMRRVLE